MPHERSVRRRDGPGFWNERDWQRLKMVNIEPRMACFCRGQRTSARSVSQQGIVSSRAASAAFFGIDQRQGIYVKGAMYGRIWQAANGGQAGTEQRRRAIGAPAHSFALWQFRDSLIARTAATRRFARRAAAEPKP